MALTDSNYIKACYGKNEGQIPIWIMRQAGRYLPEYLAVRERASFKDLCESPELIAEVVKQPIDRFNLDAAILFSDILTFLDPMGAEVSFPNGGPTIKEPIDNPEDIERLHKFDLQEKLPFVFEGIKKIKEQLPQKPLIGFAGSPFTIACYLIEGKGSKAFDKPKKFIHQHPEAAEKLFDLLAEITGDYLAAQVDAGCDAIQLFHSWDGILSYDDFYKYSVIPANKIFNKLKDKNIPRIMFVNNAAPYYKLINQVDCEAVGVDYRLNIEDAFKNIPDKAIQGNFDPAILFSTPEKTKAKAEQILNSVKDHKRLIFNLGHGIQPKTPISSVEALVQTVHNYR